MNAPPRPRVLVVDDEQQILRALRVILREAGFEALPAATGEEALDLAALQRPDAAIIDLLLPDIDGVELARRLREWTDMPLIVLSAVGEEDAKVRALAAGADDYVTKPFGPRELVARLQANLRRIAPEREEAEVSVDGLEVDLARRTVRVQGKEVHLTPTEFDLLRLLVRNRGRLMTHRDLLVSVWGPGYGDDTQVLRAHIANLRRKIEPPEGRRYIRTDPGVRLSLRRVQRGLTSATCEPMITVRSGGSPKCSIGLAALRAIVMNSFSRTARSGLVLLDVIEMRETK